jgi:hypothetical protein
MYTYNENAATQLDVPAVSELQSIHERLSGQNSEYVGALQSIEERLHRILNLIGAPQAEKTGADKRNITDYVSGMHEQLDFMSQYNYRLQQVLDHLQKIVG